MRDPIVPSAVSVLANAAQPFRLGLEHLFGLKLLHFKIKLGSYSDFIHQFLQFILAVFDLLLQIVSLSGDLGSFSGLMAGECTGIDVIIIFW